MDQSPPKRITRARAAAKATESLAATTRVVTAAARAKATRSTASTSAKRKNRSDEADETDQDEHDAMVSKEAPSVTKMARSTRGRPKKSAAEPETEADQVAPVKTRGRPKKMVVVAAAEEQPKATRTTRAMKATTDEIDDVLEPPKRATRGRPPSSMASRTAARATARKTVKFEEPEKENIVPPEVTSGKAPPKVSDSSTGLKAKPVRRPATAASRGTRGTKASITTGDKPIPLSPKKVNQITLNRVDSDDELAPNDKVPARSLRRNPIRPPTGVRKAERDVSVADAEDAPLGIAEAISTRNLDSPAKKLPQSPWKGSIKSPAKRVEGILYVSSLQDPSLGESLQPFSQASLLHSPAKRLPPGSLDINGIVGPPLCTSPFKTSHLMSPAKRPLSPVKSFVPRMLEQESERSPAPKATLLATPLPTAKNGGIEDGTADIEDMILGDAGENNNIPDSPLRLRFPGRLSAVLPRHADPALTTSTSAAAEAVEDDEDEKVSTMADRATENPDNLGDPMVLDEPQLKIIDESGSTTPSPSPPKPARPMFQLRQEVLQGYDSETDCGSEDELAPRRTLFPSSLGLVPTTPCQESSNTSRPQAGEESRSTMGRSTAKRVRLDDKFGYTPLAEQLDGWTAGPSPLKTGIQAESPLMSALSAPAPVLMESSPAHTTFFEEAVSARPGAMVVGSQSECPTEDAESPEMEDISITDEDMALAAEANEMSLLEPEQVEELVGNKSFDDSISETSQEYGDENEVPIDPTLLNQNEGSQEPGVPLVTPRRPLHREFHTVSKVPLKPADDSSPRLRIKKRGHSVSRLPVARPTQGVMRNATVISYSPSKTGDENNVEEMDGATRAGSAPPPITPTKSEAGWSTMGTPARTPRRDLDPALLRGAVVFVDVHTSEGADASGIFVELLTQMGARCVNRWSWNPASPPGTDGPSSKIGITHVVYKDGGKRTLEKVRESGGVVQCVGVSWVLE